MGNRISSFEKKYELRASNDLVGTKVCLDGLEHLIITYVACQNNLCPSYYYPDVRCIWEGNLVIELLINDVGVTINDHDENENSIVEMEDATYEFKGIKPRVINMDVHKTYLVFKVIRTPKPQKSI